MTEIHHGSNVAALQTQAVFDPDTDEWVIDTPDDGAIKWCVAGGTVRMDDLLMQGIVSQ